MRLLSYNIHKGIGGRDRRYGCSVWIDVVEAENPDLICLQEVDPQFRRSHFHDQPRLLADISTRPAQLFQHERAAEERGGYGNLILSRWPFARSIRFRSAARRKKPRGAQSRDRNAGRSAAAGSLASGPGEKERHWQVNHLLNHHLFREAEGLRTLVAGDFNDWRNTLRPRSVSAATVSSK